MSTYIDLEILHSLPFSNSNRDDAGMPKGVIVGGKNRGRLSSQSLKRAARFYGADTKDGFSGSGGNSGFLRTKMVRDLIVTELVERGLKPEEFEAQVNSLFGRGRVLGKLSGAAEGSPGRVDSLIVLTGEEVKGLADLIESGKDIKDKDVEEVLTTSSKKDLALWGRFFASSGTATMYGAAQVAHAFTTHSIHLESDYFVGLDDAVSLYGNSHAAGHAQEDYYLSGLFYKYANINIDELVLNLIQAQVAEKGLVARGTKVSTQELAALAEQAVTDFITKMSLSVPQGKIRSTAHQTLPALVRVSVRQGRPVSGASAFDEAVPATNVLQQSVAALIATNDDMGMFCPPPLATGVLANSEVREQASALGDIKTNLGQLCAVPSGHIVDTCAQILDRTTWQE